MSTAPITAAVVTKPAPNAGASVPPERIEPTTTKAISFPKTSTKGGVRQGKALLNGELIFVEEDPTDADNFFGTISNAELAKANCKLQP